MDTGKLVTPECALSAGESVLPGSARSSALLAWAGLLFADTGEAKASSVTCKVLCSIDARQGIEDRTHVLSHPCIIIL